MVLILPHIPYVGQGGRILLVIIILDLILCALYKYVYSIDIFVSLSFMIRSFVNNFPLND